MNKEWSSHLKKIFFLCLTGLIILHAPGLSQPSHSNPELDKKVQAFLSENRYSWHDMNVPPSDGQVLYDLIVKNGYRNAVEIGTSTGHSGIWIAWALSKTGGRLITIEIDEQRHREALENFRKAGLSEYIDARLGDAHKLVPELEGPFDFVFSDADKGWYKKYFIDLAPELKIGGCFTAHNISGRYRQRGIKEFVDYIESLPNFKTTYNREGSGISISYKTAEN